MVLFFVLLREKKQKGAALHFLGVRHGECGLWNLEAEGEQENLCEDGIYSSGLSCTCLTYQPHPQLAPPAG